MPGRAVSLRLKAIQAYDRWRLRRLSARHPGLEIHPTASTNLASARYQLAQGARLRIGAGVVTERLAGALQFYLERDAEVVIGDYVWVAADVTILRGVTIGEHSVIGTRSLVTHDIAPHTLAFGQPAKPRGRC